MLKSLALTLVSVFAAVEAVSEKCTNELGGIVYEPQTYAREYLTKVAANFNLGRDALFTPQADSFIQSFEQEWGVSIQVLDADSICLTNTVTNCSTAFFSPDKALTEVPFVPIPVENNVTISSIVVNAGGIVINVAGLGSYNLTSPSGTTIVLSADNICSSQSSSGNFSLVFTDDAPSLYNCATQSSGIILAPTQPLSTFVGEYSGGNWLLYFDLPDGASLEEVSIDYCQSISKTTCTRDAMKALTNIPGYRYDSGTQMAYYTEEVFDAFGNFKQVTISRAINGLYLKK